MFQNKNKEKNKNTQKRTPTHYLKKLKPNSLSVWKTKKKSEPNSKEPNKNDTK